MPMDLKSNAAIVVVALAKLGGSVEKIATEKIAYECFILAPDRFSWVLEQFREFPDKDVASVALTDAAKEKYGFLVEGKYARDLSKDGWILTPNGLRWIEQNEERILETLGIRRDQMPQLRPLEVQRLRSQITREPAYKKYAQTRSVEGVSRFMFTDMLQCSPDAPRDLISLKFNRLLTQAQLAQDQEILTFLQTCREYFQELLDDKLES